MDKLIEQDTLVKAAQNIVSLFTYKKETEGGDDKGATVTNIATKAKIAETTIRDAKNGKLKSISYEKVVLLANNLLGVMAYDPQKIKNIAELDSNEDKETFLRRFDHLFAYSPSEVNLGDHVDSFEKMRVFCAAYSNSNVSKKVVIEQMGKDGQEAVDDLLESKLIIEENGMLKGTSESCMVSIKMVQKMAQMCLSNFSHERNK